jgi:energy-coupling factor transporter ATP-binding protein EcfA2
MKTRNVFRNYIDYIQFPYFRNLDKNTRITFDFPLTVFVGQNGSGKSSTLHALYGAPKRNTPFEFWFSTAVDPIQEVSDGGDRHSFFYVYKDNQGRPLEVLKQRIFKRNNPDYWETARPNLSYGMTRINDGGRNQPIEKDVVYIDFRSELSAFDKYFYFKKPRKTKTINNKQDFLRKHSVFLRSIIDGHNVIINRYGEDRNELLKVFTAAELKQISFILGKKYISGKIVKHKLFEEWGYSVIFETESYSYSEAFAGSGEMAVVRLVLEVLGAKQYSLILLDEPEVSLHPGAQKRLKFFLLDETRKKQLQVVISSHSPSMIEELPSNAIKVFSQLPSGKFNVRNGITPHEAFYHLEQTNPARKTLIVEDFLSKEIINGVLKEMGDATASLFQINFYTGGASVIKNHFINVYSHANETNKFIVFDGDQKLVQQHFNPDLIIESEQTNDRFKQEIRAQTGSDISFYPDGNQDQGSREDQERILRRNYLKFYLRNVSYLPLRIPEEIIWNQELAENFLTAMNKSDFIARINATNDFKEKFLLVSEAMTGDKKNIDSTEKTFLEKWLNDKNATYGQVVAIISSIRDLQ